MKNIEGFGGRYAVTDDGRVWSYPRSWVAGKGVIGGHNGVWLKQFANSKGYLRSRLVAGKLNKCIFIHRLVALAFIPNPDGLKTVNHKNGNKLDNRVTNLEWCTAKENTRHAIAMGLRGENQYAKAKRLRIKDATY